MDEQIAQLQLRASNLRRFKPQAFVTEIDAEDCHSLDGSHHSTEELEANVTKLDAKWFVDS